MRAVIALFLAIACAACGQTRSAPESILVPSPPGPKYAVSGIVRDEAGQAVVGATVVIGRIGRTCSCFSAVTDVSGHYEGTITGGVHEFTVTKSGYASTGGSVTVRADTVFDITYPLTVFVLGNVFEFGVGPLDRATVEIASGPEQGRSDVTSADGHYFIDRLAPGEFVVRVRKGGYEPVERNVNAHQITTVDFTLRWAYGTCLRSVTPVLLDFYPAAGGTETINVDVEPDRTWTATSDSPWIVVPPAPRRGAGRLTIRIEPSVPDPTRRRGAVLIRCSSEEGQNVWVMQRPDCPFRLEGGKDMPAIFPSGGGSGHLAVWATSACRYWQVESVTPWIHTIGASLGEGNSETLLSVDRNSSGVERAGKVIAGDTEFTIVQEP